MLRRSLQTAALLGAGILVFAGPAAAFCDKQARVSCAEGTQLNPQTGHCETTSS